MTAFFPCSTPALMSRFPSFFPMPPPEYAQKIRPIRTSTAPRTTSFVVVDVRSQMFGAIRLIGFQRIGGKCPELL